MAAIDGLIILDSTGRPIITSHFRAHPANYPPVHIDAYNQALARRKPSYADTGVTASVATSCAQTTKDELEPVLWVTVPVGGSGRVKRGKGKQIGNAGYADDSESEEDSEDEESDEDEEQAATWQTVGLCHLEREGMSFLVPLSHESESNECTPLFPVLIAFSQSAVRVCIPGNLHRRLERLLRPSHREQHPRQL
jgi:AP-3 complex subunit mu